MSAANVIFFPSGQAKSVANPTATGSPPFSTNVDSQPPKDRKGNGRTSSVEQNEYGRRERLARDLVQMSATELRAAYPGAYSSWKNIKQRRRNGLCELHPEFDGFTGFLKALGPRPADGWTVDRKSYDNPEYSPDNCRWASKKLQTRNRISTKYLTDSQGITLPVSEWSARYSVPWRTIHKRMERGWSVDDAVRTAPGQRVSHSPAKPSSKSTGKSPDELPTLASAIMSLWVRVMSEDSPCGPYLLSGPEFGYIKQIAAQCERDSYLKSRELEVVEYCLRHWGGYVRHVGRQVNVYEPPRRPHAKFMATWLYDAKLFWHNEQSRNEYAV